VGTLLRLSIEVEMSRAPDHRHIRYDRSVRAHDVPQSLDIRRGRGGVCVPAHPHLRFHLDNSASPVDRAGNQLGER
jgi:hypothetical protein